MLQLTIFFFLYSIIKYSICSLVIDTKYCIWNDDCLINNTVCNKNYCECDEGFIYSSDKTRCLKVITSVDDTCEESQQCSEFLFAGGICDNGLCICKSGYHYLHGQCWKSSSVGEKCLSSDNCYVNFDVAAAKCKNNICQCNDNYYQREYRSCRRLAQKPHDLCAIDLDCTFDINKNYTCDKKYGCISNDNLSMNLIDKKLIINNERILRIKNATVICQRAHFYSNDKNKCVAEIGESCKINEEPLIKNSICIDKHWICNSTFVSTLNNRLCIKVTRDYNSSCLHNEQCYLFGPDALCKDINGRMKRCVCNDNSHFIKENMFCWINKQLGELCYDDRDCFNGQLDIKLQCVNKTCACPHGTHSNSTKFCIKHVNDVGDWCSESADCHKLPNTHCINNVCLCIDNYYYQSGKCISGLNNYCNDTAQCNVNNAHCKSNLCVCYDDYVEQSSGLCVPISRYGDNCKYNIQCNITDENLFCTDNVTNKMCICSPSYYYNRGKCFKQKVLDEPCNNRRECYIESDEMSVVCINGLCKCEYNFDKLNDTYCNNKSRKIIPLTWIIIIFNVVKLFLYNYI